MTNILIIGAGVAGLAAADKLMAKGGNHLITEGFWPIIKKLAAGCDIKLNTMVNRIDYTTNKIAVHTNQGIFYGDKIIVTVPLGVLQQNKIIFDPVLPIAKQTAITNLKMGLLNKIIMKFSKCFWPAQYYGICLSPLTQPAVTRFVNFHSLCKQAILGGFVGGETARQLETLSDPEILEVTINNLRDFFGNSAVPFPEQYLITRWAQDPFSCGSYSYIPRDSQLLSP